MAEEPKLQYTKEEVLEFARNADLSKQWHWHEVFRDATKNMYRTTTADAIHMREICVRSFLS